MLLLRVLDFYFRVLSVCFVLRASRELSVFDVFWCCPDSVLYLNLWFWFSSCASVLESVFLSWRLVFIFGFCGLHFPYRPRYIFDRRISVNLFTGGNLTRLNISWQFIQEKGSIISEFKQVSHMSMLSFYYYYSLVQLKVNLWLWPVGDSQSTGDTPPYQPYRSVCAAPKGRVFAQFWSQNGYKLCPFWSGIGYGFWENYGSVRTYFLFQFQMSTKERAMRIRNSFLLLFYSKQSDYLIQGQVWEWIWILESRSDNVCDKWHFLVWKRVRNWRTGPHTPTKNSYEFPRESIKVYVRCFVTKE